MSQISLNEASWDGGWVCGPSEKIDDRLMKDGFYA